jgi:hypothetical protein
MKDPVRHCELYKDHGCSHVDGFLCNVDTCGESIKYHQQKYEESVRRGADAIAKEIDQEILDTYRWKGRGRPEGTVDELREALESAERKGWDISKTLKKINGGFRDR